EQLAFRDRRRRTGEHLSEFAELAHDRALWHGERHRLAGIGRRPRGFWIVRKAGVEGLGNTLLELALADQGAFTGSAGLDEPEANLRRLVSHQGLQPDRIAQTGEAALAHDDDVACRAEHDALYRVAPRGRSTTMRANLRRSS